MFFGKKKKKGSIPIEEVQNMTARGFSDREIVKKLKKDGFAYDEIERAMLNAVKAGVSGDTQSFGQFSRAPEEVPTNAGANEAFSFDEFIQAPPQQAQQPQAYSGEQQLDINPEAIIEELIEGVIEEKWEKFNKKFKKYEEDLERVGVTIKAFEKKVEDVKNEPESAEFKMKTDVLNNRIEELEARVGGLEKAFKQLLPSLTRNIENLSSIIHEMKDSRQNEHVMHANREEHTAHEHRKHIDRTEVPV
jgi:hypothetical protein